MRKLATLMIIAMFLVLFSAKALAADMLNLKDVRVEVDDDKQSANEGGGSIDITPESKLTMKVEVENLYESGTEGGDIEDIQVTATLEDIDDGDDVEEEADEFDLRPGRDKTVTLNFDIPLKLETDETFKLVLEVEGEDKNGTIHTINVEYDVDVDKENHEVRFLKKELLPTKVSCSGSSTITLDFINTGENDEEVELTLSSPNLGYSKKVNFDLSEDIDDDENEYKFSDTIDLSNQAPGTYTISARAEYNDNRDYLENVFTLEVEACKTTTTPTVTTPEPEPEPEPKPTTTTTTTPTTTQPSNVEVVSAPATSYVRPSQVVATPKTSYNQSWWDENKWLMIILITDLVLVIAGIIVVVAVLKRRRG